MRDLTAIARLVVEEHRAAPCAVVAAAREHSGRWVRGAGVAGRLHYGEGAPSARLDTPFDLASLSKPVTALTFARLARSGVLSRSDRLGDRLPEAADTRSAAIPLDLFAAHRSGLEPHRALFAPLMSGQAVDRGASLRAAADGRRPECEGDPGLEGFPPVYSDLGYLLLGEAMARAARSDLAELLRREVCAPLGLAIATAGEHAARDPDFASRVAPTEEVPWRGGLVRGVVHDETAWALAGTGAAGHAGLFGDAMSVLELGVAVLEAMGGRRAGWLSIDDLHPVLRRRPGGSHRAGFDSRSGDAPSSGARFGPETFGHLGFTGTSLWIDPEARLVGILLTNRVHPTRASDAIRRARPAAYDAIFEIMTAP